MHKRGTVWLAVWVRERMGVATSSMLRGAGAALAAVPEESGHPDTGASRIVLAERSGGATGAHIDVPYASAEPLVPCMWPA
jgi:hypothetical protein